LMTIKFLLPPKVDFGLINFLQEFARLDLSWALSVVDTLDLIVFAVVLEDPQIICGRKLRRGDRVASFGRIISKKVLNVSKINSASVDNENHDISLNDKNGCDRQQKL